MKIHVHAAAEAMNRIWLASLSVLLLIAPSGPAESSAGAQPLPDVALPDASSVRLPRALYTPTSDLEAAIGQLQSAISCQSEPNQRARLRLKLARAFEEHARRLHMEERQQGESAAQHLATARADDAARDHAIEMAELALAEATDPQVTAEAVCCLGNVHEWKEDYKTAIGFHEKILRHYPDVPLEEMSGDDHRLAALTSIAECFACLGDRTRAVEMYLQAIPHAKSDQFREFAVLRLLDYEPRLPAGNIAWPDDVKETLAGLARRATFAATLSAHRDLTGDPVKVTYRLRGRLDARLEWYRLVYRVWLLPASERPGEAGQSESATQASRPAPWPGDKVLSVWDKRVWLPLAIRPWITSPASYHRVSWDPPFETPLWPPGAEERRSLSHAAADAQAVGTSKPMPQLDAANLDQRGEILLGQLPPGRYLVSISRIDFREVIPLKSSRVAAAGSAFVWSNPVVIEATGVTRGPDAHPSESKPPLHD